MEPQINQFWILKGHSTVNSANEYEPVQDGFKNSKYYKECKSLLALSPPRNLQFLKDNISLNITPKEVKM